MIAYLREKRVRCVIYLDDILIMNQDKESLREDVALAPTLLEALGPGELCQVSPQFKYWSIWVLL